ncbi:MAG: sulfite exporter TauE/SafE family protein, partial [Spirochaetota bacterium]
MLNIVIVTIAALVAGFINAIAGGGTLLSFPALLAIGVPPVTANVTNTLALLPGYLGGTLAQWPDIRTQWRRLLFILPLAVIGGLAGGILLLSTGEKLFSSIVPALILAASALLALQLPLRSWLQKRVGKAGSKGLPAIAAMLPLEAAAVYGGYFGAGLSVIVLAVLGIVYDEKLSRLNALKQAFALAANIAAAICFAFSGKALWVDVMFMASGALVGGQVAQIREEGATKRKLM